MGQGPDTHSVNEPYRGLAGGVKDFVDSPAQGMVVARPHPIRHPAETVVPLLVTEDRSTVRPPADDVGATDVVDQASVRVNPLDLPAARPDPFHGPDSLHLGFGSSGLTYGVVATGLDVLLLHAMTTD